LAPKLRGPLARIVFWAAGAFDAIKEKDRCCNFRFSLCSVFSGCFVKHRVQKRGFSLVNFGGLLVKRLVS
jgi:hypothetical protein